MDHDVTVYLYSDSPTLRFSADANFASTTASALLAAGTSSLSVYARDVTVGTHALTASDKATIDNPDSGILNAHQNISISAGNITGLAFQAGLPETIAGGSSAAITVATQNRYGVNTPVLQNTTLYLFSSSPQGKFAAAEAGPWSINTLTIPAGQASATFYYRDGVTGNPRLRSPTPQTRCPTWPGQMQPQQFPSSRRDHTAGYCNGPADHHLATLITDHPDSDPKQVWEPDSGIRGHTNLPEINIRPV